MLHNSAFLTLTHTNPIVKLNFPETETIPSLFRARKTGVTGTGSPLTGSVPTEAYKRQAVSAACLAYTV